MNKYDSHRMLFEGIKRNDKFQVRKALEFGANINERNHDYLTPLHLASSKSNVEIAHILITMGADVNLETYSNGGRTALDFALSNANERLIEILIDKTSNVNSSLLFYMSNSYRINLKTVRLLIEKGANVNVMDTDGWTPLHWALKRGYDMGVKLLLSYNADVNIKNKMGMTALDFANFNKSYEIRRIFKKMSKGQRIVTEISNNSNKNTYQMDNKRKVYVLVSLLFAFIYTTYILYYEIGLISFNKIKSSESSDSNKVISFSWDEINGKTVIYDLDKYKLLYPNKNK